MLRKAAFSVVLACLLAACATWTPRRFDDSPEGGTYVSGVVRVTLRDGTRLEMRDVRVSPDSLIGFVRSPGQSTRVGLRTSTVASIHERDVSPGRTALLLVVLGVAATGVLLAAMTAGMGPDY